MELVIEDLPNDVTAAKLSGRMDIDGAQSVDMRFAVLAGSKKRLIVDLTNVDFLASMGLRTLMACSRSIASKGGKMAIANPQPGVAKVLATSGLDQVVPVSASFDAALAAVTA